MKVLTRLDIQERRSTKPEISIYDIDSTNEYGTKTYCKQKFIFYMPQAINQSVDIVSYIRRRFTIVNILSRKIIIAWYENFFYLLLLVIYLMLTNK